MSLQEMPKEVERTDSFWLHEDKVAAWLLITALVLIMAGGVFRVLNRITWPAIFLPVPFLIVLLSKEILQKVHVQKGLITVRKFNRVIATFDDFEVGVFERRTGRRVLPYMFIKKRGLSTPYEYLQKLRSCSSDVIYFNLSPNVGMKVLAYLPEGCSVEGEKDLNAKNTAILDRAKQNAAVLRKSIHA